MTQQLTSEPVEAARCPTCHHLSSGHDVMAERYCAATTKSASLRGCICRGNLADMKQAVDDAASADAPSSARQSRPFRV